MKHLPIANYASRSVCAMQTGVRALLHPRFV